MHGPNVISRLNSINQYVDVSRETFIRKVSRRDDIASRPVSRVLFGGKAPPRRPFLWGADRSVPRATNPGGGEDRAGDPSLRPSTRAAPIRSCSRWGLPCRLRCRTRGALLPHRFTLAFAVAPLGRSVLCGTFPGVAPGGR